jgi:hypothetical protein
MKFHVVQIAEAPMMKAPPAPPRIEAKPVEKK